MQHDSHEFMAYFFSSLQDEETPMEGSQFDGSKEDKTLDMVIDEYFSSHPSIIDKMFSGIQKTVVTCKICKAPSITYNPFMTLSLAFETSLEKCI